MNRTTKWETDKLNLAAYLITAGISDFVGTAPAGHRVKFQFAEEPEPDALTDYYTGAGKVSALRYSEALTSLKAAIFEIKRGSQASASVN